MYGLNHGFMSRMINRLPTKYDPAIVGAMFEFLRAAICDSAPKIKETVVIDWAALQKISAEQGVLSWVWDGICMLPEFQRPSRFSRISWGLSAQQVWDRYQCQKVVLKELVEICQAHDMRLMLLKGIGLSHLYPKPQSRPSGDIDIYLFEDFEKGNKVFLSDEDTNTGLHTEFVYKGVQVENHEMFIYPNTTTKKLTGQYLLRRAQQVVKSPEGYYTFASMDNLVYLMMHALNHVNFNVNVSFLNIRNLTDIAVLIKHYRAEWNPDELTKLMQELLLGPSFELVLYFSEWLLKMDFSEYHRDFIKSKDLVIIKKLFMENCLTVPSIKSHSFFVRFESYVLRYYYFHKIYKYMPQHKKSFFWSAMHQFLQSLKRKKSEV